jgi:hypothetical protein
MARLLQILLHPVNYFRHYWLETFGQRAYERIYLGDGNYFELPGWLYRGNFYPLGSKEDTYV